MTSSATSYLECHEISQEHDVPSVDTHTMFPHGVNDFLHDGRPVLDGYKEEEEKKDVCMIQCMQW